MDDLTKAKLIYSGELLVFAIAATVLGILFIVHVISVADWKKWAFTCVTLLGGCWCVTDFIWTLVSPKKRAKNSLLDKILLLPNGVALIGLDIFALISLIQDPSRTDLDQFFQIEIGVALLYIAVVYVIEGIYHYFKPHPSILEAVKEDEENEEANEESEESTSQE
ncbi:MAG: hypothetical protein MJ239_05685 [Bacilli bacterium]|nr:hypothetical protein [Bacilli bacterium]